MNRIAFEKYQGLGNDFVLFDLSVHPDIGTLEAQTICRICDRHYGVGADGILFFSIEKPGERIRMVYFNADGRRAETCFNGLRCIARHAVVSGVIPPTPATYPPI
jgi:diaminopimelate epimerase